MTVKRLGPAIILVQPQMGENIGAAARAMLNCGLTDLRLVSPRDGWPNETARANASGALSVIDHATLYNSLAEAVADRRFVIATTARGRDMAKTVLTPEQAAEVIHKADHGAGADVSAIVFGPERAGLVNLDVTHCDAILTVPLNPDYSSLNIAQAVLLVAYQWYLLQDKPPMVAETLPVATKQGIENLLLHLTDALDESGFFSTAQQRPTIVQNLRNMIQRTQMSPQEVRTFHGMIKALRGKEWKK